MSTISISSGSPPGSPKKIKILSKSSKQKSSAHVTKFSKEKSIANLRIEIPKFTDTINMNAKTELQRLIGKIKLITTVAEPSNSNVNSKFPTTSPSSTNEHTSTAGRKKSLPDFIETMKSKDIIRKSRASIINIKNELLHRHAERLPLWKHQAKGNHNPDPKHILKGKKLWRAITMSIIGLTIRPIRIKYQIKLLTRDQECLELTRAMYMYTESCDSWLSKFISIPMTSICQDSTLDFVPQTFMRRSIKERKRMQLKVRLYAVINGVTMSGLPPPHLLNFFDSLTEDENYFPNGFLFRKEKRVLGLDKLGATQQMIQYIPPIHATAQSAVSEYQSKQNGWLNDKNTVNNVPSISVTTANTYATTVNIPTAVSVSDPSSLSPSLPAHPQQQGNMPISPYVLDKIKPCYMQIIDTRNLTNITPTHNNNLHNNNNSSNNNKRDIKQIDTRKVHIFDVTKVKMFITNFVIVRILINHLCLCPWMYTACPPDEDNELKCVMNSRILAMLVYEVARNMDGTALPSLSLLKNDSHSDINADPFNSQKEKDKQQQQQHRKSKPMTRQHRPTLGPQSLHASAHTAATHSHTHTITTSIQPTTNSNSNSNSYSISTSQLQNSQENDSKSFSIYHLFRQAFGCTSEEKILLIEESASKSKEIAFSLLNQHHQQQNKLNQNNNNNNGTISSPTNIDISNATAEETTNKIKNNLLFQNQQQQHHYQRDIFCHLKDLQRVLYPLEYLKIGFEEEVIAHWIAELAPKLNKWVESITYAILIKRSDRLLQLVDNYTNSHNNNGSSTGRGSGRISGDSPRSTTNRWASKIAAVQLFTSSKSLKQGGGGGGIYGGIQHMQSMKAMQGGSPRNLRGGLTSASPSTNGPYSGGGGGGSHSPTNKVYPFSPMTTPGGVAGGVAGATYNDRSFSSAGQSPLPSTMSRLF